MKYVVFLGDGMADEPIDALGGKTPLQVAKAPNMDWIAGSGQCGTLLTLPEGFPTSSDVANLSVLGYDLRSAYTGRGPLEAAAAGLVQAPDEVIFRCNLIFQKDGLIEDYSGGHVKTEDARVLMEYLNEKLGNEKVRFHPGVSYRNLLILKGEEFSPEIEYAKPDSSHGLAVRDLLPKPQSPEAQRTAELLVELMERSGPILEEHPLNAERSEKGEPSANLIWPWSPGRKPVLPSFEEKYGKKGAVVSAVDVIFGIGFCAGMTLIRVPGATGWIDTNYEGKARAAAEALKDHDFVYIHLEAIDEVGHLGELEKKIEAIEDFDRRLIGTFFDAVPREQVTSAVLPDHPVPIAKRKHTRTPVPVAIYKPGLPADSVRSYSEVDCPQGELGPLEGDAFMRRVFA